MTNIDVGNTETGTASQTSIKKNRRAGGRATRVAARAAALPDDMRPIRAGLSGGTYKPLSDVDILKIHHAALDALEIIGLADAPPSGIKYMVKAGAILGDDGRLRYPRSLVEDMLSIAAKQITLCGRDEKHDLHLADKKVHYGCAVAAVHMVDLETSTY